MSVLTLLVWAPEYSGPAMHSCRDECRNIPALTLWANTAYSPTDFSINGAKTNTQKYLFDVILKRFSKL